MMQLRKTLHVYSIPGYDAITKYIYNEVAAMHHDYMNMLPTQQMLTLYTSYDWLNY
jgi:hypothetical protein